MGRLPSPAPGAGSAQYCRKNFGSGKTTAVSAIPIIFHDRAALSDNSRRERCIPPLPRIIVPACPDPLGNPLLWGPMTNSFIPLLVLIPASVFLFTAADDLPTPPVAKKIPHVTEVNGHQMVDNYFWLREKTNPEVRAYLEGENTYADAVMKPTEAFQKKLYDEIPSAAARRSPPTRTKKSCSTLTNSPRTRPS